MNDENKKYVESIGTIRIMRNAMIVYSFVPIVFMAVNFVIYTSFQPITAERYVMYSMNALCGLMMAYPIGILLKKKLMLGILSKSGLVLTAVSFLIVILLWNLQLSPRYLLLAISFYVMGQVAFVAGACVSLSLKLSHILFYVILGVCYFLRDVSAQSAVAIVALAIMVYPMAVSYLAVNWASKEFFNLNR